MVKEGNRPLKKVGRVRFCSPMDTLAACSGGGGRMQTERRGISVGHQLLVTLENICNGATR